MGSMTIFEKLEIHLRKGWFSMVMLVLRESNGLWTSKVMDICSDKCRVGLGVGSQRNLSDSSSPGKVKIILEHDQIHCHLRLQECIYNKLVNLTQQFVPDLFLGHL